MLVEDVEIWEPLCTIGGNVKWYSHCGKQYQNSLKTENSVSTLSQSCLTLRDLMDHSLPGSSAHGIFQATILEWLAISCSRGSSWPGIKSMSLASPALASGFFTTNTIWKAPVLPYDPAILHLGIYPKELKVGSQRDIYKPMFIAALFIIYKTKKTNPNVHWQMNG